MAALLSPDVIADHLRRLPGWRQEGPSICKTFAFDGFLMQAGVFDGDACDASDGGEEFEMIGFE